MPLDRGDTLASHQGSQLRATAPAVKWESFCNQVKKNEVIQGETRFESCAPYSASPQMGHCAARHTQKPPPTLGSHRVGDRTGSP